MTFQLNEICFHKKDGFENVFWIIHGWYTMTEAILKNHISIDTKRRSWIFKNSCFKEIKKLIFKIFIYIFIRINAV